MKILFDSNVWQQIVIPGNYKHESAYPAYQKIQQAIIDHRIHAFLSETIFTIEALPKKIRRDALGSKKVKMETTETAGTDNSLTLSLSIGPDPNDALRIMDTPILEKYLSEALRLGFKIASLPRIGGLVNKDVEKFIDRMNNDDFNKYCEKLGEVLRKMEDKGAGMAQIKAIGKRYNDRIWMKGLKKAPESENKIIAKAAAEWADGDAVAISIGLGCDCFCTRDQGKGAGIHSVLSKANLEWLGSEYGLRTIIPEQLASLI